MTAAATLACCKARLDQSNLSGKTKTHAIETADRGPVRTRLFPLGELTERFCHDCRLRRRDKLRSDEMATPCSSIQGFWASNQHTPPETDADGKRYFGAAPRKVLTLLRT